MLVGGGVGITPVIGLLKDIFLGGQDIPKHCMEAVHAVWVMPDGKEAEVFIDVLKECLRVAAASDDLPELIVSVYCTRVKPEAVAPPLLAGRPDFPKMLDLATDGRSSALIFACGPEAMVNHLWDEATNRTSTDLRVDFHHETFEL